MTKNQFQIPSEKAKYDSKDPTLTVNRVVNITTFSSGHLLQHEESIPMIQLSRSWLKLTTSVEKAFIFLALLDAWYDICARYMFYNVKKNR